jgi:LmbE family N-acetylglucosaminyl deacetylase
VKVATGEHLPAKRAAIEAYRTQVTRYDGSDDWLPLPAWLLQLCSGPYEVFFPVGR